MSSGVFMADTSLQPSLSVYLDYCCQNTQEVGCTFDKSINKGENPDAKWGSLEAYPGCISCSGWEERGLLPEKMFCHPAVSHICWFPPAAPPYTANPLQDRIFYFEKFKAWVWQLFLIKYLEINNVYIPEMSAYSQKTLVQLICGFWNILLGIGDNIFLWWCFILLFIIIAPLCSIPLKVLFFCCLIVPEFLSIYYRILYTL